MKIFDSMDVLGNPVLNVATPPNGTAAVNKDYVDTKALPAGGTTGQVLAKTSGTDFAVGWVPPGTTITPNTGWSVTSGYTADKAFNPESTTVTELARVVGTLIDALKAQTILGS